MKRKVFLLMLLLLLPQLALAEEVAVAYIDAYPDPVRENQPFEIVLGGYFPGVVPPAVVVQIEGRRIILRLPDEHGGPLINVRWGERVRFEGLPAGRYDVIVRGLGHDQLAGLLLDVLPAPFSVSPAYGLGGTEVLIEGVVLPLCDSDPCFTPVVLFGNTPSPNVRITAEGDLVAVVPANLDERALLDVSVRTASHTVQTLPQAFTVRLGDSAEDFEYVLLPLSFAGPGAHGSNWVTRTVVRNDAPIPVATRPLLHPTPGAPFPFGAIPSGQRVSVPPLSDTGVLFGVQRGLGKWLTFSSHIVDLSRTANNLGTEIPVVRAEDTAPVIRLLNVPLTARFRAHLRIYSFDREEERGDHATIVVTKSDGSRVDLHAQLMWEPNCGIGPCRQELPAFALVDLSADPRLANAGEVDLTIYGPTNDLRLWAFVSVANNETQRVTLWTPQHDNQTAGVSR